MLLRAFLLKQSLSNLVYLAIYKFQLRKKVTFGSVIFPSLCFAMQKIAAFSSVKSINGLPTQKRLREVK